MKAYINGIVLNGHEDMKAESGLVILEENSLIVDVCPQASIDLSDKEVIDLKNAYIMPGLINLHVHIPATGKPSKKPVDAKKVIRFATANGLTRKYLEHVYKSCAKTELYSGVTTLRSVGGVEDYDSRLRNWIDASKTVGPRILSSDMAVSVPGGHMAGSLAYEAHNPEEAVAYVEQIAKAKPNLIKLMITGGVLDAVKRGEPGVLKMSPEIVKAACDAAHALGLPVAAHVESSEGVRIALQNGVDTIEHGALPDEEIIALFKERQAAHIATISPALPYALFDREVSGVSEDDQYNGKVVFDGVIACAKACLEKDIPVGLGTDTGCPYITHYDMWRELVYFHKYCDVSNEFALYSATLGNARIAHIDHVTGSIEKGKSADMIVCNGNPLQDLTVLRYLDKVIYKGHIIDHPHVKKMTNVESELDKYL